MDTEVARVARELAQAIAEQCETQDYRLEYDKQVDLRLSFAQVAFLVSALREYGAQGAK